MRTVTPSVGLRVFLATMTLGVLLILLTTASESRATGPWTVLQPAPVARMGLHTVAYDNNGHLFVTTGLLDWTTPTDGFYRYDIATDSWTQLASTPQRMFDSKSAYDGAGHIYLIQGGNYSFTAVHNFYRYDIASNTWSQLPPVPLDYVAEAASCSDGRHMFVTGGNLYDVQHFYSFDMTTLVWTELASPPGIMSGDSLRYAWQNACATDGQGVYLFGGDTVNGDGDHPIVYTNRLVRYDIATNQWFRLADGPEIMIDNVAVYDGHHRILVSRGFQPLESGDWVPTAQLYSYDISSDEWTQMPDAPGPMSGNSGAYDTNADAFFITAGLGDSDAASLYEFEENLVPPTNTPTPCPGSGCPTSTATSSPTSMPSPLPTSTPSPSPTSTPSPSPTSTPNPSPTSTRSPSATPTPPPSATAKPSQGVGGTVMLPPAAVVAASDTTAEDSGWSGGAYAALAVGLSAAFAALGVGGWYAKKRWLH